MARGQVKRVWYDKTEDGAFGIMEGAGPEYRFQAFPKVMYHATQAPKTVKDKDALEKLGKEWKDAPQRAQDGDTRAPVEE